MLQHGADDLDFVLEALDEQRADRTVDQAGNQGFLFRRTTFALEEAARDLARGVGLLDVVDGQGEEVLAGLGFLGEHGGGQDDGFAHGGQNGAVSLTGDATGFEDQRLAAPLDRLAHDFEHICFFRFRRTHFLQDGQGRAAEWRSRGFLIQFDRRPTIVILGVHPASRGAKPQQPVVSACLETVARNAFGRPAGAGRPNCA